MLDSIRNAFRLYASRRPVSQGRVRDASTLNGPYILKDALLLYVPDLNRNIYVLINILFFFIQYKIKCENHIGLVFVEFNFTSILFTLE